jgi:hypothetical protein
LKKNIHTTHTQGLRDFKNIVKSVPVVELYIGISERMGISIGGIQDLSF